MRMLFLLCACAPTRAVCPAPAMAATVGGAPITVSELDQSAARQIYEVRASALDQLLADRVLDAAAQAAHLPPGDLLRREVEKRVPPASPAEAHDFYERNKDQLPQELAQ